MTYINSQAGLNIVADIPIFNVTRASDRIPGTYISGNTYANGDVTVANNTVLGDHVSTNRLKNPHGKPIYSEVPINGGNYCDINGNPITPKIYFESVPGTNLLIINKILSV